MRDLAELRWRFLAALWTELRVVWPILSGLVGAQLVLGMLVGYFEGWRMSDATYFTFVTGLTIGYGDLVPIRFATRLIAVVIGFSEIPCDRLGRGCRCSRSPGSDHTQRGVTNDVYSPPAPALRSLIRIRA